MVAAKNEGSEGSDHEERVKTLYDERSSEFHRIFTLVTGLTLLFFVVFLLPYVIVKADLDNTNRLIESKETAINYLSDFSSLYNRTDSLVEKLKHDFLPPEAGSTHWSIVLDDERLKNLDLNNSSAILAMKEAVSDQFTGYNNDIDQIDLRLDNISAREYLLNKVVDIEEADLKEKTKESIALMEQKEIPRLNTSLQMLNESIANVLSRSNQNQVAATNPLTITDPEVQQGIKGLYGNVTEEDTRIATYLNQLREPIKQVNSDNLEIKNYKERLIDKENTLRETLKGYQSPIGTIPIGIDEAVALFPLALLFGFLLSVRSLKELIKLRKEAHGVGAFKPDKVALVAPLWVDPLSTPRIQWMQIAIFLLPFFISAVSVGIIIYMWSFEQPPQSNSLRADYFARHYIQIVLYGISLAAFLVATLYIRKEVKSYRSDLQKQLREEQIRSQQAARYSPEQLLEAVQEQIQKLADKGLVTTHRKEECNLKIQEIKRLLAQSSSSKEQAKKQTDILGDELNILATTIASDDAKLLGESMKDVKTRISEA
jgi:hypothetical protein